MQGKTGEVDGVDKADYGRVVDQCYLCDVCYMTKCPYVPPHPWNVDFPHLMLRAKARKFVQGETRWRDRLLTSTDRLGKLATIPVVVQIVNKANAAPLARKALDGLLGVHPQRRLPPYASKRFCGARPRVRQLAGQGWRAQRRARSRSSPPATSITTSRASGSTCS